MTKRSYELTYDLPGASGGHRADPQSYDYPEIDCDDDGYLTAEAENAYLEAQRELDIYVATLVKRGAKNIRGG